MSLNSSLNAVIAILEGRPSVAKEILRNPTSDVKNVPEVLSRLHSALSKHAAKKIKNVLTNCLSIQPPLNTPSELKDHFFQGVRAVEELFEKAVEELED